MKNSPFAELLCRIFSGSSAENLSAQYNEVPPRNRGARQKKGASPQGASRHSASRRAAFAHPRALATTLVMAVLLSAWWVSAQGTQKEAAKPAASGASASSQVSSNDLEGIVRAAAARQRAASSGFSAKRFALTESNITPGTQSDERQPSYSPTGAFIVFKSNGVDANGDGRLDTTGFSAGSKYHIWIMNRDGSQQRQITGLTTTGPFADVNFDQDHPAFSPDGNFVVFAANGLRKSINADGVVTEDTTKAGNLFVLTLSSSSIEQITNFQSGQINGPNWGGATSSIAFSHTGNLDNDALDTSGNADIFQITQTGQNLRRLTGGVREINAADRTASNLNPAFSLITPSTQVYFSSNRTNSSGNNARRIWLMNGDGNSKRQITNPTARPSGAATDNDDYPAPSLNQGNFQERVGFQSDSLIDSSDNTRDLNVWSVNFSTQATPTPVPTNTPLPPPPASLNVNNFGVAAPDAASTTTGGQVKTFDLNGNPNGDATGNFIDTNATNAAGANTNKLEGIVYGADANNDGYPEAYVSNRSLNRVERYDGRSGQPFGIGGSVVNPTIFIGNGLAQPTALAFRNGNIYVGSGTGGTNNVKAFNAVTGAPVGNNGDFTNSTAGGITNGIEGIAFDGAGNLYVSAVSDNKIVKFDNQGGVVTANFATGGVLQVPTGLGFGPDGNLYVSSSGNDDIVRYNGTTGAFIDIFVNDNNGTVFGLDAPEGLVFGPGTGANGDLYVSSFNSFGGVAGSGDRVLRFRGPNTTVGSPGGAFPAPGRAGATFATFNVSGPSYLTFNPSATDPNILNPPPATPTPVPPPPLIPERAGNIAQLESNRISSPGAFTASRLPSTDASGQALGQDVVEDVEPGFSRSVSSQNNVAQLAFSSQRRTAAIPGSRPNPDGSIDTRPIVSNPYGGVGGSHDIWVTASQDFTAPILVQVSSGNARFPVLAPGPQAPANLPSPRTAEAGLLPGTPVRIAFVVDERESGLNSVAIRIFDATNRPNVFNPSTPSDATGVSNVNENIPVQTFKQIKPNPIGALFATASNLAAPNTDGISIITDAGPNPTDGSPPERQAGAVAGDGIYYVEGRYTPPNVTDYYFDIQLTDVAGNTFNFDNIWGFTNQAFSKASPTNDLFVSDYMQGQNFPATSGQPRFFNAPPVENYYLTMPGGIVGGAQPRASSFDPATVDVWRILSRGPVPFNVMLLYAPTQTLQIDPANPTNPALTRSLPVANSAIIWGAPYAGLVTVGPGTIVDTQTQLDLTNFLNRGGRLFLAGRSIAFSLTGNRTQTNTFLNNELGANYAGDFISPVQALAPSANSFELNVGAADNSIQMPYRPVPPIATSERATNSYLDGNNAGESNGVAEVGPYDDPGTAGTDGFAPTTITNGRVLPAYNIDGTPVGQRIEHDARLNNFQSRVVFFGFNFDGINRRYTIENAVQTPVGSRSLGTRLGARAELADQMRYYFKTGSVRGLVRNNATGDPIPNFLLRIDGPGGPYYVRTSSQQSNIGTYELLGLPSSFQSGGYVARPAVDANGNSLNPGYVGSFSGDPQGIFILGPRQSTANFRVNPAPLSSISGVATQSNGTFADRRDDTPLFGVRVLVRSITELLPTSQFPSGGRFVKVTTTDSGGRFSFAGVPTQVDLEVIFNPDGRLISQGGDVPDGSAISPFTADPNLGRRLIPDAQRPQPINIPDANPFILNDGTNDTAADDPLQLDANGNFINGGPILVPVGRTITGKVFLNATPLNGAALQLTDVTPGRADDQRVTSLITQSGAGGNYSFFDIKSGTYQIIARYTRPETGLALVSAPITVTVAQADVVAPNIYLFKQDVTGRVTLNGGPPDTVLPIALIDTSSGVAVKSGQTAADGTYTFLDVPPGTYIARTSRRGATFDSAPFTVSVFNPSTNTGGDAVAPTIELFARVLSGRVTVNGVPTGGLPVQLLDANGNPVPGRTTTSAADGTFSFNELPNTTFFVQSSVPGRNGTDIATSPPLSLQAGNQPNVELALFLHTLTGTVTLNGNPTGGVTVEVFQNGQLVAQAAVANDGTYSVDRLVVAPNGTVFQVRATRFGPAGNVIDRTDFVSVNVRRGESLQGQPPYTTPVPNLELATQIISGRVTLNGQPVVGARVELLQSGRVIAIVASQANGVYSFTDVGVGTFTVRTSSRGDSVSRAVTITRGNNAVNIDLKLFLQTIRGRVFLNTTPLPGVRAILGLNGQAVRSAITDASGIYTFTDIPAGRYQVQVTSEGQTVRTPVFEVQRGRNAIAPQIKLIAQQIIGRVTLNGKIAPNAPVELTYAGRRVAAVRTNAQGIFNFDNVQPATYLVSATVSGLSASKAVTIKRGSGRTIVLLDIRSQSIRGRVLVDGTPKAGQDVDLLQGTTTLRRVQTNSSGIYTFENVPPGSYTVRTTFNGVAQTKTAVVTGSAGATVEDFIFRTQSVSGGVSFNGRPAVGAIVQLLSSGATDAAPPVRTGSDGKYTFSGVQPGVYVVAASLSGGGQSATGKSAQFRVTAGQNVSVPTIALALVPTDPPGTGAEDYVPGQSYQISVPYADSSATYGTTTVARAFTLPPVATNGTVNYVLSRYDALTSQYVTLDANSVIRRGEGLALQPKNAGVSLNKPSFDPTRIPTSATEFQFTLRRDPSSRSANAGFNLIGFPFDPARVDAASIQNATVVAPDGRRFLGLEAAQAAGIVNAQVTTLGAADQPIVVTDLQPFVGYFIQTFVDNVQIIVRPGATPIDTTQ